MWYFDELDLLRDQETQIQGTSPIDKPEFIKGNNETEVQFFFMHTNTNSFMAAQQLSVSDMFNEEHHKTV